MAMVPLGQVTCKALARVRNESKASRTARKRVNDMIVVGVGVVEKQERE